MARTPATARTAATTRTVAGSRLIGGAISRSVPDAWWRCADLSGTTLTDSSGNGHSAALTGSEYALAQASITTPRDGASLLSGTGVSNGIATATGYRPVFAAGTIELWFKPTALNSVLNTRIFTIGADAGAQTFKVGPHSGAANRMTAQLIGSVNVTVVTATGGIAVGTTYHVVAVYTGTQLRIYLNGQLIQSAACTAGTITPTADTKFLANTSVANNNVGNWQDVAFYARALQPWEVRTHYALGAMAARTPIA